MSGYYVLSCFDIFFIGASLLIRAATNPAFTKADAAANGGTKSLLDKPKEIPVRWYAVGLACGLVLCSGICEASLLFWCYSYVHDHLGFDPNVSRAFNSTFWA